MSPLPITRSALDRLGERLVANDSISDEDYDLLLQVLTAYQSALDETHERLVSLGYEPTTRVKTTAVLIEKLRREHDMKLKGVQDIAGARLVVDGGRLEQDWVATRIIDAFSDGSREPKVKDRRAEPSAGYRAVHVVVTVQDVLVEIQVRTPWQDQWAQIVEALGDKWGRGIRYGLGPTDPGSIVHPGTALSRQDLWNKVVSLADFVDEGERIEHILDALDLALNRSIGDEAALKRAADAMIEFLGSDIDPDTIDPYDLPSLAPALEPALVRMREVFAQGQGVTREALADFAEFASVVQ